ncbi:MAG: cation:proton antiporter [Lacunisphaera sp.]|nr:cation:proton antiporter [Lacunisphaera sp.]
MTSIELLVILLLLVMAVPDACAWLGRPALAYPVFVCFGLLVGPMLRPEVGNMIQEAGQIGFVLLLFEVGLEIDLPVWRELRRPSLYLLRWVLPQYPVLLALARFAGLPWLESFVAAAALSACSVGMAHAAWKTYPGLNERARPFVLHVMVLLEVLAVVLLSVETAVLGRAPTWLFGLKLAGMALVVYACSRMAVHVTKLLQLVLEKATRWRLHFVTLLVLAICAIGERFGLSGPKTAFFLGLFSSRVRHDGGNLEDWMAPISKRFLIPLFFTALGTQMPLVALFSRTALLGLIAAALIIACRHVLHARFAPTGGDGNAYLLLCPNFTLVALAASSLLAAHQPEMASWLLLTGLLVTLIAVMALPRYQAIQIQTS